MLSDRAIRTAADRFRLNESAASPGAAGLEILLDASLSMTSGDGAKEDLARELCILLLRLAESAAVPATLVALKGGGRDRTLTVSDAGRIPLIAFDSALPLQEVLAQRDNTPHHVQSRVIVSDFLVDCDPAMLVQRISAGASGIWLVQLFAEEDLRPEPGGQFILQDLETEQAVEVVLDEPMIQGYLARLSRLREGLDAACVAAQAKLAAASAAVGLGQLCEGALVPAGLLRFAEPPQPLSP